MIALLQRTNRAHIVVEGRTVGSINRGIVAFIGVERGDTQRQADRLLERIVGYRLFADAQGRMNLSLHDLQAELLLVPQFTLAADTRRGSRASFTTAAEPETGKMLFEYLVAQAEKQQVKVQTGVFGADMQVHLVNEGPVTFWLQVKHTNFLASENLPTRKK